MANNASESCANLEQISLSYQLSISIVVKLHRIFKTQKEQLEMNSFKIKLLSAILGLSASGLIFASNTTMTFKTLDEAQAHCPAPTELLFTANNPMPNSAGAVTSSAYGHHFASANNNTHPQSLSANNMIIGANYQINGGIYGYQQGNKTACYYSYTNLVGSKVFLLIRD